MKKTKYIYKHTIYGGSGPNESNSGDVRYFFEESGVKLHVSKNCLLYTSPSPRDRG